MVSGQSAVNRNPDKREYLREIIEGLEHVLPGQAPIRDFVHHNTLHGFQHLSFEEALSESTYLTSAAGYFPIETYREFYQQGRISAVDVAAVIAETYPENEVLLSFPDGSEIRRNHLLAVALIHGNEAVTPVQLRWKIEEEGAHDRLQSDIESETKASLLADSGLSEKQTVSRLWDACMELLGVSYDFSHPETQGDLTPETIENLLDELSVSRDVESAEHLLMHRAVRKSADQLETSLWDEVGKTITLSGLLKRVTGEDVFQDIRPILIRHLSAHLDQGVAAWRNPHDSEGFYKAWRQSAQRDFAWIYDEFPDWVDQLEQLDDDPVNVVLSELKRIGISEDLWESYLQRISLELPGWSGMFLWRHLHPGYEGQQIPVDMFDYLAVRLVLERLYAQRLCWKKWRIEATFPMIRWHFRRSRSEFYVRRMLFSERLPEFLLSRAVRMASQDASLENDYSQWQQLANMLWNWMQTPEAGKNQHYSVYDHGWRLFRLAQYLSLSAENVASLTEENLVTIFDALESTKDAKAQFIWLQAYERHYRDQLFNAFSNRQENDRKAADKQAQLVFCMDEREEAFRRHLEEINPAVETLGAAGFFNVPIYWHGLDDEKVTALCPVVVTPVHEIREQPLPEMELQLQEHKKRRQNLHRVSDLLNQDIRRNLLSSAIGIMASTPLAFASLLGKVFAPLQFGQASSRWQSKYQGEVETTTTLTADKAAAEGDIQIGFTDEEQVRRVYDFLRTIGLASGFSPLVVIIGHGSSSQNNPHRAAYDCGACSGRHGGPNARVFARMANSLEVRRQLHSMGLEIPNDVWFVGALHNTCDESFEWYDETLIPEQFRDRYETLKSEIFAASERSAHERSRKFASAPSKPTLKRALEHIQGREKDFSQARPELGHATNAAAVIGRRSISQGLFLDRRVFLISYDPTIDEDGTILERLLLSAGPVGAGINLEYYFSTVDNAGYGAGSKVTHNIAGFFGVMDGASSDLRTGLPKQMIEIHEAMRLQVLVEAKLDTLAEIYGRQPPLQELIGNGWLLLSAIDPDSGEISVFYPHKGFVPWDAEVTPLPVVEHSIDWYSGHMDPLSPAAIQTREISSA